MVFDQYWATSIKGGERSRRGSSSSLEVYIHGPSTPIPKQSAKYITNPRNKINLCDFPTSTMCSHRKEQLADGKKLVIGGGYKAGEIAVSISNGALHFLMKRQIQDCSCMPSMLLTPDHGSSFSHLTLTCWFCAQHTSKASAVRSFGSRPVSEITTVMCQYID